MPGDWVASAEAGGDAICSPYSIRRLRSTSRISTSTTSSGRALSKAVRKRLAVSSRWGVSRTRMALTPEIGEMLRMSLTVRSASIVSLRSAFWTKNTRSASSRYSRRLAGVSGTTVIVDGPVTW